MKDFEKFLVFLNGIFIVFLDFKVDILCDFMGMFLVWDVEMFLL